VGAVNRAHVLQTERLVLRDWRPADVAAFAEINADPRIVENLPGTLTRAQMAEMVERIAAHFAEHGHSLWAVEVPGVAESIGFIGLQTVPADLPFAPAVEVEWRLAAAHWGHGYATERTRAAVGFAFGPAGLPGERLGMTRDPAKDFDHPRLPVGHRLRPHVLYRRTRPEPNAANAPAARCGDGRAPHGRIEPWR